MIYRDISFWLKNNARTTELIGSEDRVLDWPTSVGLQVQRVTKSAQSSVSVLQGRDEAVAQLPTVGDLPDKCPRHWNESQNKPFTLVIVKRYF